MRPGLLQLGRARHGVERQVIAEDASLRLVGAAFLSLGEALVDLGGDGDHVVCRGRLEQSPGVADQHQIARDVARLSFELLLAERVADTEGGVHLLGMEPLKVVEICARRRGGQSGVL